MAFEPIDLSLSSRFNATTPATPFDSEGKNLYLDHPRVAELPEEGCITFKFRRGPVTLREGFSGHPGSASADLTLIEICNVKAEKVSYEGPEEHEDESRTENQIDELFESLRSGSEPKEEES